MRYLGNKEKYATKICQFFERRNLLDNDYTLFDAFCGSGCVSDKCKNRFSKIIINDNLLSSALYSLGRLNANSITFKKLGFNPMEYFNSKKNKIEGIKKGFVYNHYSLKSGRSYFNDENACRIDYVRLTIQRWYDENLINEVEFAYLIASLLESVSNISNTRGSYSSFLEKNKQRKNFYNEFIFTSVSCFNSDLRAEIDFMNANINEIIESIDCDVLYIDPPRNSKDKYDKHYHLLETIARYDYPQVIGKTGNRKIPNYDNSWNNQYKSLINFEHMVAKTRANYIVVSCNDNCFVNRKFVEQVLGRYCINTDKKLLAPNHKKTISSFDSAKDEYIIYGEKLPSDKVIYTCPINYPGNKSRVVKKYPREFNARENLQNNEETFIDLFAGGFNAGINALGYKKYIYNDLDSQITGVIKMLYETDAYRLLRFCKKIIKTYNLDSSKKEYFNIFKDYVSTKAKYKDSYFMYVFLLILYSFRNFPKFKKNDTFANSHGNKTFDEGDIEKIISFSRRLKEIDVEFLSLDYQQVAIGNVDTTTIYIDPPYMLTHFKYRWEWSEADERRLINYMDKLCNDNYYFLLSNVLTYKKKKNELLKNWIQDNNAECLNCRINGRKELLFIP